MWSEHCSKMDADIAKVFCNICKKSFSKRGNLQAHVKKFHPGKLEELPPSKQVKCAAICNACNKTFVKYSNLKQHVEKFHKDQQDELLKPKCYTYACDKCTEQFTHLRHFKSHMKCHQENNSGGLKCILCKNNSELVLLQKPDLFKHFQEEHDITVVTEVFKFDSLEQFENWKKEEEKKTNELFVNAHGTYKTKNFSTTRYVCHRSGTYKSKGSGVRHLKTQGSKKICGFCPAEIYVQINTNGIYDVKYVKTHIGHRNDLGHLHLSETERQTLAVQIASKIPFETILDQVRESVFNGTLERSHLVTKKDLWNIERCFNINSEALRHKNDAISIDAWVKEMESTGCVLFYKPQGEDSVYYPQLHADDFALIIMNQGQTEMLDKYGSDCICIDETHGLNAYQFNLTTVLVLDNMREGFPCSFLISNRSDEEMMYIFMCIRNNLGRSLQPKVFMSDMAQAFFNVWVRVMDLPQYRLYCTWHIDRAWRNNLNKVQSKEKQVVVYKQLRTLLQETDSFAFTTMMQNFLRNLSSDTDTAEFGHYFQEYYGKNVEAWAYCYRINSGLNTNMHIESMHRSIKYIYLNGKVNKRLDKAIHILMKFVRDKLFGRLIVLNKGKISAKLKDLRARHKTSLALDVNSVLSEETGWMVPSSSSQELYKIEDRLTDCDCKLACSYCEACIHRFSCSCIDSCIKWNMCKHIHLVCKFLKEIRNEDVDMNKVSTQLSQHSGIISDLTIDEKASNHEELQIVEALSKTKTNLEAQFSFEKEKLKLQLLQTIDGLTCAEELDVVKKIMAPIQPTLTALRNCKKTELAKKAVSTLPHNKNIDRQRRLYKTKKSSKQKIQLPKPDTQETNEVAWNLLI